MSAAQAMEMEDVGRGDGSRSDGGLSDGTGCSRSSMVQSASDEIATASASESGAKSSHAGAGAGAGADAAGKAGTVSGANVVGPVVVVSALTAQDTPVELAYTDIEFVNSGAFGAVFRVRLTETGELAAIKKVPQDTKYKNRELYTMKGLSHPNLVQLHYYFYSEAAGTTHLCLVMDYLPSTVHKQARAYRKHRLRMPMHWVKLWTFQLLRGLAAIHADNLVHRDVKPQNLLVNRHTGLLKLCDFGTAKVIAPDAPSTAYVCSRYYRAPELILGASFYSVAVDTWAAGCVLGELLLQRPLFPGRNSVDQLVEIIKVLGTPTADEVLCMNADYPEQNFPHVTAKPLSRILPSSVPPEAIDLLSQLLQYTPERRPSCMEALTHPFFDELRTPSPEIIERTPILTSLFDFTPAERAAHPLDLLAAIAVPGGSQQQ